jgi:hypothetical protein
MEGARVVKIKLDVPIKIADEEIFELTFKRLTAYGMKSADKEKGEVGKTIALIAKSARIPKMAVEQLDSADFLKISEAFEDFLSNSPQTGKKSLEG